MKARLAVIVILLAIIQISCGKMDTDYDVINYSSYSISMREIANANVTEVLDLAPSTTIIVIFQIPIWESSTISFTYTPANLVTANIDTNGRKITFRNK
jgi:hypothetical protein